MFAGRIGSSPITSNKWHANLMTRALSAVQQRFIDTNATDENSNWTNSRPYSVASS
jgi:hypothetical protein